MEISMGSGFQGSEPLFVHRETSIETGLEEMDLAGQNAALRQKAHTVEQLLSAKDEVSRVLAQWGPRGCLRVCR